MISQRLTNSNHFIFQFKRAKIFNQDNKATSFRISKSAWLRKDEDDAIERIYQRVGDLTGLSMETSEQLQVSNYGIGGYYEPHFDFARVRNSLIKIYFFVSSKIMVSFSDLVANIHFIYRKKMSMCLKT